MNNSENQKKYNIQLIIKNIGPHSNLSQCIDAGENGALRIAIYATNGSGKSSISKQFRLLNLDEKSMPKSDNFITLGENSASFFFKLFNQNTPTEKFEFKITHSSINKPSIQNSSNLIFHTFNSDYVKQSIEPVNYGQGKEISKDTFEPWAGLTLYFYDSDSIKLDFGNYGLIDAEIINEPKVDSGDKPSQRFWYIVCKKENR